jgi:ATP-dependent 26S proteasome regulatory subunit
MENLREVLEIPLLHPKCFMRSYSPSSTTKMLTPRAAANWTNAYFIRVISSELVQKYVNKGACMVYKRFTIDRVKHVRIVFFDKIDAIDSACDGGGALAAPRSRFPQTLPARWRWSSR